MDDGYAREPPHAPAEAGDAGGCVVHPIGSGGYADVVTVPTAAHWLVKKVAVGPDEFRPREYFRARAALFQSDHLVVPAYEHEATFLDVFLSHEIRWDRRLYLFQDAPRVRCMIMAHEGVTASQYLRGLGCASADARASAVISIVRDACRGALDLAAHGLIPIDLKADNVLVGADGAAKVSDLDMVLPAEPDLAHDTTLWQLSHVTWGRPPEMLAAEASPDEPPECFLAAPAFDAFPEIRVRARVTGRFAEGLRVLTRAVERADAESYDAAARDPWASARARWRVLRDEFQCFDRKAAPMTAYAIGALLAYLLAEAGVPAPVGGSDAGSRAADLAVRCLAPDPRDRPPLSEVAGDLAVLAAAAPAPATAPARARAAGRYPRSREEPFVHRQELRIEDVDDASREVVESTTFLAIRWLRARLREHGHKQHEHEHHQNGGAWPVARAVMFHVGALKYPRAGEPTDAVEALSFHPGAHATVAACFLVGALAAGDLRVSVEDFRSAVHVTRRDIGAAMTRVVRAVRPHLRAIVAAHAGNASSR